jgi:murein DD-endopeptidase MepM/ murein hydrolase activator NlpD
MTVPDTARHHHATSPDAARRPGTSRRIRRGRVRLTIGAVLIIGSLLATGADPSLAAPGDLTVDQGEIDRQRLQDEQVDRATKLDPASASSEELIAAMTTLEQAIQAHVARGAEAERAYNAADRRVGEIDGQLGENQVELDRIKADLRRQAIQRYVQPERDDSSVRLLQAGNIDDAQQRKVLSEAVAGDSQDLIERLKGTRGRLSELRNEAETAKADADARRQEHAALSTTVLDRRKIHDRLKGEWEQRMANLKAAQDQIDAEAANRAINEERSRQASSNTPAAAPAPRSSNGRLIWPVSGTMGDGYGGARNHGGIDILAPVGTPIWAADGGRVVQAVSGGGFNGGYGNLVVIDHPSGLQTRYAHLNAVRVSVGQTVSQGHVVGTVGMTGRTSGPHLHFETYMNGARQNPSSYLP